MAPKKTQTDSTNAEKSATTKTEETAQKSEEPKQDSNASKDKESKSTAKKRKAGAQSSDAPAKAQRRSGRSNTTSTSADDQIKLLNFLLSPSCLALTRPADEREYVESNGGDSKVRTYSASELTPLEELISAMILSRPIGHRLGLRSIRTLFNDPHNLTTLLAIRKAGNEGVRAVLDEARTQHRQKTAEQLVMLADFVTNGEGMDEKDTSLGAVRKASDFDPQKERAMLQEVKGLAKTGLDIFGRRIQGVWPEWYPFGDERTMDAISRLGLPGDAEDLKKFIENQWDKVEVPKDISGQGDEKKRKVFVRVLERAIGSDLEGSLDEVKREALS